MNILYISSKEFLPYMIVSMLSLCENNKEVKELNIYLYSEYVTEDDKSLFRSLGEKYNRKIQLVDDKQNIENFKNLISQNGFPEFYGCNYTYAKILPNILLPDLDKLLVIDCDTLILKNITDLYETDVTNYYGAAVPELLANYVSSEDKNILKLKDFYFNTGVLLFNIKKMNETGYNDKIVDAYKKYKGTLKLADQSLFNLALKNGDILALNFKYNYNNNFNISKKLRKVLHNDYKKINLLDIKNPAGFYKDISIIHFVGSLKPWNNYSFAPYKKLFKRYQNILPELSAKNSDKQNKNITEFFKAYIGFRKYRAFFDSKFKSEKFSNKIFSITNDKKHKIVTILGIKFKFKCKPTQNPQLNPIDNLNDIITAVITNEIPRYIAVQKLHTETFGEFKFKHANENIAIIGCGPSVKYYNNEVNAINIALNRAIFLQNILFKYMFVWDYKGFVEKKSTFFEDVKSFKDCTKFYGKFLNPKIMSIPEKPDDKINNIRHFYSCKRWGLPGEKLPVRIYPDIDNFPLADFMSVSFPAIQFALYTYPKKIYLIGLDTTQMPNYFGIDNPYNTTQMIKGYKEFQKFAKIHYPDIEIISINPVGLKGIFKDVYTQSYVDEHPELLEENIEIINEKVMANV